MYAIIAPFEHDQTVRDRSSIKIHSATHGSQSGSPGKDIFKTVPRIIMYCMYDAKGQHNGNDAGYQFPILLCRGRYLVLTVDVKVMRVAQIKKN